MVLSNTSTESQTSNYISCPMLLINQMPFIVINLAYCM